MIKLDVITDSLAEINIWVLPDVGYSSILFLNDKLILISNLQNNYRQNLIFPNRLQDGGR